LLEVHIIGRPNIAPTCPRQ